MRSMRMLVWVLIVSCGAPAAAQRPPTEKQKQAAKAHFERGRAYYDARRWDAAIREYEAAYGLVPLPALQFNIAQALRLKGDKVLAIAAYQRYLALVPEGTLAEEARMHVATLRSSIQVDEAEAARRKAVGEAETARRQAAEAEAARRRSEAAATGRPLVPGPEDRVPSRRRMGRWVTGWVLGGASLAVVGVGAYFGSQALVKSRDANSHCPGDWCTDQHWIDVNNQARHAATAAYVTIPIGVAMAGVSAFLLLTSRAKDVPAEPRARAVPPVLVTAGPGGAALSVGGTW